MKPAERNATGRWVSSRFSGAERSRAEQGNRFPCVQHLAYTLVYY
jgi:hypothetical protein